MFDCYEALEAFVSKRIGTLRTQHNISARDMSLTMGQGAGYISNIENKNNMPSMKGLCYICEYFKIDPKDFFDEEMNAPGLLLDLLTECKNMSEESLQLLLGVAKTMKK